MLLSHLSQWTDGALVHRINCRRGATLQEFSSSVNESGPRFRCSVIGLPLSNPLLIVAFAMVIIHTK
jgi:hypothetical protein